MAFPYLETIAGLMTLTYIFETYLDLRQHKVKLSTQSQKELEKSYACSLVKSRFHLLRNFKTIAMDISILYLRILPWLWKSSVEFLVYIGLSAENEIVHSLVFLAGLMFWNRITDLPFSLYSTIFIEAREDSNKQPIWIFLKDMIKDIVLAIVFGPPIVAATIIIVRKGGPYLVIYLWAFMLVVSLVTMAVFFDQIAPLFIKFTPLPAGELRSKIEHLASSLKLPLSKLVVVDGTRSTTCCAYMKGIFNNKQIVLYDTSIQQCENYEEEVAFIAHELGHWKLNHTVYNFISREIRSILQYGIYILITSSKDLFLSFGFHSQPVIIGILIYLHAVKPFNCIANYLSSLASRAFEFQADAFAWRVGYGAPLQAALVRDHQVKTTSRDPWYSAYRDIHPSLMARIAALDLLENKKLSKLDFNKVIS